MSQQTPSGTDDAPIRLKIPFAEYVALSAFLTALTALSIDIMLPALPSIAQHFALNDTNDRQLVVILYFVGFGIGQLFWGPISDRLGRIPILMIGLSIFICGAVVALLANSFEMLVAARIVQGLGSASARVTITAIARDLFAGAQMARVMSLIMTVFILVPIIAPIIGQGLLYVGSWRLHFTIMLSAGLLAFVWAWMRLPETRPKERRNKPGQNLGQAVLAFSRERLSVLYLLACSLMFGCLCAFIANAQQIFGEFYELGDAFPFAFGGIASAMAAASLTNARIVMRRGTRVVCHASLTAFAVLAVLLMITVSVTTPPLPVFMAWLGLLFYLFSMMTPNMNAIIMEPMGQNAGLASSALGFSTSLLAAAGGWLVGGQYDGTLIPFATGFAVFSVAALALVILAEGRKGMYSNRNERAG